jgi:hypothetical protein
MITPMGGGMPAGLIPLPPPDFAAAGEPRKCLDLIG